MDRRKFRWLIILASLAGLTANCFAQEAISTHGGSRDSPLEAVGAAAASRGVEFPVAFTTEVLGNLSGGTSRQVIWESLLNVGITVDFEKLVGWKGATLSIRAIYPQGFGLTDAAVPDFNTLSNLDGYDTLRLYDA